MKHKCMIVAVLNSSNVVRTDLHVENVDFSSNEVKAQRVRHLACAISRAFFQATQLELNDLY